MRTYLLTLLTLLAPCAVWAAVPTDEESERGLMFELMTKIEDLQPRQVPGIPLSGTIKWEDCIASFDAYHSFDPAEHWCLVSNTKGFLLRSWKSASGTDGKPGSGKVIEQPIRAELGLEVRQLWLTAILKARYPPVHISGMDGTTFVFSVRRYYVPETLSAQTWLPDGELPPKWLSELGSEIFARASKKELESAELRDSLSETKAKVLAFYESRP